MRVCIILFSKDITCSLLTNERLVLRKSFDNVESIPNFLNKCGLDKLVLVYQGTPVPSKTNDSFKVGDVYLHGSNTSLVVRDKDVSYFLEMASILKIKDVYVHSYLDYIKDKYKKDNSIIVVDSYIKDYCVLYIEYGEIKDFIKCSRTNLSKSISRFKTEYKCPVVALSDRIDIIGLKSTILNISLLPKQYQDSKHMCTFEYISYFYDHEGENLLNNTDNSKLLRDWKVGSNNAEEYVEEKSEELISATIEKPESDDFFDDYDEPIAKKRNKIKKNKEKTLDLSSMYSDKNDESSENSKFLSTCINLALVTFVCFLIIGVALSIVYRGKVDLVSKQVDSIKLQEVAVKSTSEYLNGDLTKSPMKKVLGVYQVTSSIRVNNYLYENGETSIIALSKNGDSMKENEKMLRSIYNLNGKSFMGKFKDKDKTYDKTKYLIGARKG